MSQYQQFGIRLPTKAVKIETITKEIKKPIRCIMGLCLNYY